MALAQLLEEGPTNGYSGPTSSHAAGTPTLRLSATSSGTCVLTPVTTKRLEEVIPRSSRLWLRPGDVLVQRSNTLDLVGTTAIFSGPPNHYVYPDLMMRLRFRQDIVPGYVVRFMNSPSGRAELRRMAAGAAASMPKISGAKLRELQVPVPSFEEQRRIADILDRADALRAKRRAALALLDELTQSIFLDMFGDPAVNSGRWPAVQLGEVLDGIDSGWSPNCLDRPTREGEWGVLKLGAVTWCDYAPGDNKALPEGVQPEASLEVHAGDLLMTRKNTYDLVAASVFVRETPPRLMLPDLIYRLRPRAEYVLTEFLQQQLVFPTKRKQLQKLARGAAESMPNLSKGRLLTVEIIQPPLKIQQSFIARLDAVHRLRRAQRGSLAEMEALFASLQDRAFRGEL
jgi:type I restriction enzyme S subunit